MLSAQGLQGAAETVWQQVVGQWPDFSVEVLPELDSTNSELMRRGRAGQTSPTLLVAERQTAGRGRLGRDWRTVGGAAPGADSLTFSLGLVLPAIDLSGLSLAVGVAVVDALHPDLGLKWPNDVWLAGRKLAGILIETTAVGDQRWVVIGVGINLLPRPETDLRTPPAALCEVLPQATVASVLQAVGPALARAIRQFTQAGFADFQAAFARRDVLRNRTVQAKDRAGQALQGVACGVDASGALLVHTARGVQVINSAEVSVRPLPPSPLPTPSAP